jgi:hypothetical protein
MEGHPIAQMLDPLKPLRRRPPDRAVDLVAAVQEEVREI